MESQPQNPEFRNNPENFNPCAPQIQTNQSTSLILHAFLSLY